MHIFKNIRKIKKDHFFTSFLNPLKGLSHVDVDGLTICLKFLNKRLKFTGIKITYYEKFIKNNIFL